MSESEPNISGVSLGAADQAALDALMDAGFDLDAVPASCRDRAQRVGTLLGLLDTDANDDGLAERTMDRIKANTSGALTVSAQDQRAIDHLVESGWDSAAVPENCRTRARRAERLLGALSVSGVTADETADLADRTMDLIAVHAERARCSTLEAELGPRRRGFRLADVGSIAAILLIGVAIFWPVLGGLRASVEQRACEQNLHNAGVGFGMHASDRAGRLPMQSASLLRVLPGQATWWDVGTPERSHSANLFQLVKGGFASMEDLSCPGNHYATVVNSADDQDWRSAEEVSYSYQLFGGQREPRLATIRATVLLTDKSPVIERARRGERIYAEERSHNHGGAGQHVLFVNGSVGWLTRPVTETGDNLWLPAALSGAEGVRLKGTELPVVPGDVFVGP